MMAMRTPKDRVSRETVDAVGDELMILSQHQSRRIEPLESEDRHDGEAQSNQGEAPAKDVPSRKLAEGLRLGDELPIGADQSVVPVSCAGNQTQCEHTERRDRELEKVFFLISRTVLVGNQGPAIA